MSRLDNAIEGGAASLGAPRKEGAVNGPGKVLTQAAARFGDEVALVTATRTMTFRELHDESDRVATALLTRGLRPGQAISLSTQNRWEWVVSYHGALKAGVVVNPVNVMLTPEELAFVLRDCGAAAVLTSAEQAAAVVTVAADLAEPVTVVAFGDAPEGAVPFAELLAADGPPPAHVPDPDSPCTIAYTSGTTGHPCPDKIETDRHGRALLSSDPEI